MKKFLALLLIGAMTISTVACGGGGSDAPAAEETQPETTEAAPAEPAAEEEAPAAAEEAAPAGGDAASSITLWTYPIGKWGDEATVKGLTDAFTEETGITVNVEFLAYADGDDKVNTAITAGQAPDLIMEGPERLVANWGANGYMVDLSDMLDDTDKSEIQAAPLTACTAPGGDQGTRALVNNLYGGSYTDAAHTAYTWNSPENVKALEQLKSMDGIAFDASLAGGDEIAKFYQGILKMAFCWNIAQQLDPNGAGTGAGLTVTGDEIAFMSFPSETGESNLQGGIWGFGIFDNGDAARIEASKKFIKYMADSAATADAVKAANYFAVRSAAEGTDLSAIWADNEIMNEYQVLMPQLGDYYQVTPGWAGQRTAWWTMLQKIGSGMDVTEALTQYEGEANAAAAE